MLSKNPDARGMFVEGNEAASRGAGGHTNAKGEFKPCLEITIEADGGSTIHTPIGHALGSAWPHY